MIDMIDHELLKARLFYKNVKLNIGSNQGHF